MVSLQKVNVYPTLTKQSPSKEEFQGSCTRGRKILGTVSGNTARDALVSRNDVSAVTAHMWTGF